MFRPAAVCRACRFKLIPMIRKIVALVTLGLVGGGLPVASADTIFVYQGAPKVQIGELKVLDGSFADAGIDNRIQPSMNSASNTVGRVYHSLEVHVITNGDLTTIDRVTACLYDDSEAGGTLEVDGTISSGTAADASARASACGYGTDGTADTPPTDNPAQVASFVWEGADITSVTAGDWRVDGTNEHSLLDSDQANGSVTANETFTGTFEGETYQDTNSAGYVLNYATVTFVFALSHAVENTNTWGVRATAKSTSFGPDGQDDATSGNSDDIVQGDEDFTDPGDTANYGDQVYGAYFFAGFNSGTVRQPQDFLTIQEGGAATLTNITTGEYWSNDAIDITMTATDFSSSGGDTLALLSEQVSGTDNKGVRMICIETGTKAGVNIVAGDTGALIIGDTSTTTLSNAVLLDGELASNVGGSEGPASATNHDCTLEYGAGAVDGDAEYSNTVTLGILDDDTSDNITAGEFGNSNEPTISPTS